MKAVEIAASDEGWGEEGEDEIIEESKTSATHYLSVVEASGLNDDYPSLGCKSGGLFDLGVMPYQSFLKIRPTIV